MVEDEEKGGAARRRFLQLAGIGTVGGAVAVIGAPAAKATDQPLDPTDRQKAGYRETAHVLKAYDLSRF